MCPEERHLVLPKKTSGTTKKTFGTWKKTFCTRTKGIWYVAEKRHLVRSLKQCPWFVTGPAGAGFCEKRHLVRNLPTVSFNTFCLFSGPVFYWGIIARRLAFLRKKTFSTNWTLGKIRNSLIFQRFRTYLCAFSEHFSDQKKGFLCQQRNMAMN